MGMSMSPPIVHRRSWTRLDYDRVVESGGFGPEDRLELLDGEIWEMTPQGSRHAAVYSSVQLALQQVFGTDYLVRCQLPRALDDRSEPEPDLAVVEGTPFDYLEDHPTTALLVVEMSDSSVEHDRGRKLAAYARNGIPEYWLFDLRAECLEAYRDPVATSYREKRVLRRGNSITPLSAHGTAIAIGNVLPPDDHPPTAPTP